MTKINFPELAKSDKPRHESPNLPKGIKSTPVFDTYWKFAQERQEVFFKRIEGAPWPWTEDRILINHKFTNAFRASDRVSQYLIRQVIYGRSYGLEDVFFRTILFKIFNKIETWELLESAVGEITWRNFRLSSFEKVLSEALSRKVRIYSAAYIMPSGGRSSVGERKHQFHLRLLSKMMEDGLPQKLAEMTRMRDAFEALLQYPSIGRFLSYQYVTDLNYGDFFDWSEMEFVCAGPGAKDGIRKCFSDFGNYNEEDLIRVVTEIQEKEFERLGLPFRSLWGRPLQLIDCQNLFCEVDKYSRVAHPEFTGVTGRRRIKQKFSPMGRIDKPWYPPKWGIHVD